MDPQNLRKIFSKYELKLHFSKLNGWRNYTGTIITFANSIINNGNKVSDALQKNKTLLFTRGKYKFIYS
jgi:hypothetical protein